jgi:hypothetical protein
MLGATLLCLLASCGEPAEGDASAAGGSGNSGAQSFGGAAGGAGSAGAGAGGAGAGGTQPELEPTHVVAKNHPDGCSDEGPGSPAQPWCTIGRATALANPGDVILIREGIYSEIVDITRSGSSDAPITWIGEKSGNEHLTIIDPGVPVTSGWVPAPEVGSGVFKHASLPFVPYVVRENDLQIGHINPWGNAMGGVGSTATWPDSMFDLLATPADHVEEYTLWRTHTLYYWESLKAAFGWWNGVGYIRYRNGDDPNGKTLLMTKAPRTDSADGNTWIVGVQTGGSAPHLDGYSVRVSASHNVLRDLYVRGSTTAVALNGTSAHDNVIEDCRLRHGQGVLVLSAGAHHNVVRDNVVEGGRMYAQQGAWIGTQPSAPHDDFAQKAWGYGWFKRYEAATEPPLVVLSRPGNDNQVLNNHVHGSNTGITLSDYLTNPVATGTIIAFNRLEQLSSTALMLAGGDRDTLIHDNVATDCNFLTRFQSWQSPQSPGRRQYYFRNSLNNPEHYGTHFYWNVQGGTDVPELWLYQNTTHGGSTPLSFTSTSSGATADAYSGVRIFNNILLGAKSSDTTGPTSGLPSGSDALAMFQNNLYRGSVSAAWKGTGNLEDGAYLWSFGSENVGTIEKSMVVWDAGLTPHPPALPESATVQFGAWDIGRHELSE